MTNQGFLASRKFSNLTAFWGRTINAFYLLLLVFCILIKVGTLSHMPNVFFGFLATSILLSLINLLSMFRPLTKFYDFSKMFPEIYFEPMAQYKPNSIKEWLFALVRRK